MALEVGHVGRKAYLAYLICTYKTYLPRLWLSFSTLHCTLQRNNSTYPPKTFLWKPQSMRKGTLFNKIFYSNICINMSVQTQTRRYLQQGRSHWFFGDGAKLFGKFNLTYRPILDQSKIHKKLNWCSEGVIKYEKECTVP